MDPSILSALPTDSLYKFLALAGLLVLASGLSVPFYLKRKLRLDIIDLLGEHELLSARSKRGQFRSRLVREQTAPVKEWFQTFHERLKAQKAEGATRLTAEDMAEFMLLREQISEVYGSAEQELTAIETQLDSDEELSIRLRVSMKKSDILARQLRVVASAQKLIVSAGALMTVLGFGLWYFKVQQYADQIQVLQLWQAELQVAKLKREEREALQTAPAATPAPRVEVSSATAEGTAPGAGGMEGPKSP